MSSPAAERPTTTPTARTAGDPVRGVARGSAPVPLSVLDLATVGTGHTAGDALRTSTELARRAEAWGFHRFWVAEHHSMPGVASASPAVLIAHLAAATRTIRLGSGGVMLPNHAPLVVAEQFGTLQALHPGRIDLGLGRAPGTDPATARALRRGTDSLSADDFPQQLAELTGFLDDAFPEGHRYSGVHAVPGPVQGKVPGGVQGPDRPPIWLLGSSGFSARLAGSLGLPFSFAHHFAPANTLAALELYRGSFRPSAVLDRPYAMVAAGVVAADTEAEAVRQARAGALAMLRLRTGRPGLVPSAGEAEAHPFSAVEEEFVGGWLANLVHGDRDGVRAGLDALLDRTGADELMISSNVHGHQRRLRSYELVAEGYGLV
ncbi:alkanal monooxygenase [Wenjunlia vitaminophila]|uniref:Alkanal monooxygenase n=1 Tax=Wenjunlia vitaminophila TaxID=76728 RepID=A0A0T6LPP6_WENVI|nr:LLM class flavin-dependent oxidoreductase [Wenjunlia vitaminophila]KRV47788.1 alkanal monooxygenase [Wenjunlia vitaminophila]